MRKLLTLCLVCTASLATEKVAFKLPDACGTMHGVHDFDSRYLLLVYQGIP